MMPSFRTTPKVFQNSAYSSGLLAAKSSSKSSERLTSADLIFSTVRLFCSSSRDTFKRQIGRIDQSAHEAQVRRQQFGRLVHDEDALDVQLNAAALLLALEQIERRALRQVQQRGVFDIAFDLVMRPDPRAPRNRGRCACRTPDSPRP